MKARWLAGAVAAGAAVIGVLWMIGDGGDDGPSDARPSISLPEPAVAGLDAGGAELAGLLDAGRERNYHARYVLSGPQVEGESSVEVWRRDANVRQDTEVRPSDGAAVRTSAFQLQDRIVTCAQQGDEPWACSEAAPSAEPGSDVFGRVEDQVQGVDVEARDDEIDGRAVRCFDFDGVDGPVTLCVTRDGVPALLTGAASEIRLVALDDDVPPTVFTPPSS